MTATVTDAVLPYDEAVARFDPVLGLEVHVELNTASKMFCGCATGFGAEPNTQVCPTCLGLPGAMPVVNATAVESAIRIGLALNCDIAEWCRFARKNYFYPDMPKNFQTSQYDEPICQAVRSMLARIGMKVTLNAQTRLKYFAEINSPRHETSFYMLGWTPTTYDALNTLFNLAGTRNGVRGNFNSGGHSNPAFDTLLDENAVSHIALGDGDPALIGESDRSCVNDSAMHLDFMIGGDGVDVTGVERGGARVPVLRGGSWQL